MQDLPAKQELEVQQEPLDQQEIRELEGMAAAFLVATRGATDWVAQEGMKEQAALAATLVAWASLAALPKIRVFGPITRRQIRSSASAGHVSRRGEIILAASKRGHGTSLCSLCCG